MLNPTLTRSRVDDLFERCRRENRAALILYLTSGFPDPATTARLLPVLAESGCDLIELGVPFSDPIADGPVIQKASTVALEAGTTFDITLDLLRDFRRKYETPVILFGALNPFLRRGLDHAARMAREAGADGVLAADLPLDEADEFQEILTREGLHLITLVAPTTPESRLQSFAGRCTGFVYCISYKGTTGTKSLADTDIQGYLARLRRNLDAPLALGFGIRTPADVKSAVKWGADAVVVGSSLISLIEEAQAKNLPLEGTVADYVRSLRLEVTKE